MGFLDTLFKRPEFQTIELKKAFDSARYGMAGVPQYPDHDRDALINWSRKNELVYACIRKKCEAAADPELIVEKYNGTEWERVDGHPLVSLIEKPNLADTFDTFLGSWIASEECTGDFYAEIIRQNGVPVQLWPLDPACMYPIPNAKGGIAYYEFHSGQGPIIRLNVEDVLHRRKPDLQSRYYGLAPLKVALGSVDADQSQTDYVRAFFHSDGIPAGLLTVEANLSSDQANELQQGWMARFRRNGSQHKQVGVLGNGAKFQTIGTNLSEIEGETTRGQAESRICMVFGVPPALVGSYVGMNLATNDATMRTAMEDFWVNTMSPMMKSLRVFLTWNLLPEFEDINLIRTKKIRVNWDMAQVMAMQEDEDIRHNRARENFKASGITINEFREQIGMEPIEGEDYFLQAKNVDPIAELVRQVLAVREPPEPLDPKQLEEGMPKEEEDVIEAEIVEEKPKSIFGIGVARPIPRREFQVDEKTFVYDGMILSREPRDAEKAVDLKGIAHSYDSGKERLGRVLKAIRDDLITQSVEEVKKYKAGNIYELVLTPPVTAQKKIRKEIDAAFLVGRDQVAKELAKSKAGAFPETKELSFASKLTRLVDLLVSRMVNEIQTRAANVFASLGTLGLEDETIVSRLKDELGEQSLKVFESFASQAVNAAINAGRDAEAEERKDEWARVEYSAILDANTCDECEDADGMTASDVSDLPPAPNPDCKGGAQCRCFHIFIGEEGNA